MPTGCARSTSARTCGRWPACARTPRTRWRPVAPRRSGRVEESPEPAGLGGLCQLQCGPLALVALEALPVVREMAREEDLAGEEPCRLAGAGGLGPREGIAELARQVGDEGVTGRREQGPGGRLELRAVLGAGALGRGPTSVRAQIHHELQGGHLDRLLDALAELSLDALDEAAGVTVLVRERAVEGPLAHGEVPNIRRSPAPSDSGLRPRSAKKRDGSATLSSRSMMSWSLVSG